MCNNSISGSDHQLVLYMADARLMRNLKNDLSAEPLVHKVLKFQGIWCTQISDAVVLCCVGLVGSHTCSDSRHK